MKDIKSEDIKLEYLEKLWKSEEGKSSTINNNLVKDTFENPILLADIIKDELKRKKLAEGLLLYHKSINIDSQDENVLNLLLSEIQNSSNNFSEIIAKLVDFYSDFTLHRNEFLKKYFNSLENKEKMLNFNWKSLYNSTDYKTLLNFLQIIKSINPELSLTLSQNILSYIYSDVISINKNDLFFLEELNEIHIETKSTLNEIVWIKFKEISFDSILEILITINQIFTNLLESYKKNRQLHEQISTEEDALVKNSLVYTFSEKFCLVIEWRNLQWSKY